MIIQSGHRKLFVIPHENAVQGAVVAAGEEVAVKVDFGVVEGHDVVGCVGSLVADEDEALEEREETLEVDAVHVAALHAIPPEVGDITAGHTFGFESSLGRQGIGFDDIGVDDTNYGTVFGNHGFRTLKCLSYTNSKQGKENSSSTSNDSSDSIVSVHFSNPLIFNGDFVILFNFL